MRYWLVMPAAGVGTRFGERVPKQYASLRGRSVIEWSLAPFLADGRCMGAAVALASGDTWWPKVAERIPAVTVCQGGAHRCESVRNALLALNRRAGKDDWVLVHDAARPCLPAGDLDRLLTQAGAHPVGGILALPVADTLKRALRPDGVPGGTLAGAPPAAAGAAAPAAGAASTAASVPASGSAVPASGLTSAGPAAAASASASAGAAGGGRAAAPGTAGPSPAASTSGPASSGGPTAGRGSGPGAAPRGESASAGTAASRNSQAAGAPAIEVTVDRTGLWRASTPQMFRYGMLLAALEAALAGKRYPTDESQAMEWQGHQPLLIEGSAANVKITTPADLALAQNLLAAREGK